MKARLLAILFLSAVFHHSLAQDSLRVSVIANVKENMIQLRWGVNSPRAWKLGNQYGYTIERYTVVRDNVILAQPEKVVLTATPLKPQPLNNWESLAKSNSYAAIIAQAIYGEDFQLSADDAKGVSKLIALAQEMEQRFMVSMYAADLCYPGALLAGWGYEDKTARKGERYLYRVLPAVPQKVLRIENGSVYTSLAQRETLPEPQELNAIFGDKSVMLTWNYGLLSSTYIAYYIEKSRDGKSFTRLSDTPFMNMNSHDGKPAERMYHIDSLADNSNKTFYRIIGVTSFSEEGPPSNVVSGVGVHKLIYVPNIRSAIPNETGGVDVTWEFDERGNGQVKSFELRQGTDHRGPFTPVVSDIPPAKRSVTYDKLLPSNYFVIAAIPANGEATESFPVLVQPVDSIPPSPPVGLTGIVDTMGVVRLTWKPNAEKDLLGYRIFRGQTKEEEMIPITDVAIRGNEFVDTVDVRNLNSKVYYSVIAVDWRYNQSAKSSPVEIVKPDLVPPSAPFITDYKVTAQGVFLKWVTGSEDNLAGANVFRKGSDGEKLIKRFVKADTLEFTDSSVQPNTVYTYTIETMTASGLRSAPSPKLTVRTLSRTNKSGKFTGFNAQWNKKKKVVELTWVHDLALVREFEIYRGEADKPVSLWKVVKGFESGAVDEEVSAGLKYQYIIKAVMENGATGSSAKTVLK